MNGKFRWSILLFGLTLCGNVMAQVKERVLIPSIYVVEDFDNTTFCAAFLENGNLRAFRDIVIADVKDIDK